MFVFITSKRVQKVDKSCKQFVEEEHASKQYINIWVYTPKHFVPWRYVRKLVLCIWLNKKIYFNQHLNKIKTKS